jgi:hypothetical protein
MGWLVILASLLEKRENIEEKYYLNVNLASLF